MKKYLFYFLFFLMLSCVKTGRLDQIRYELDLSGQDWFLWLDKKAEWNNDILFLPPVDLAQIPVHSPTCGWDSLSGGLGIKIQLPATVEEYLWGENANGFGVSGNYTGVSWFSTYVYIPEQLKNRRIILAFESVRMRAEIFVNRKLAGYDLINGTPFEVDITDLAKFGKDNFLAVRITDPNGNFTWRDYEIYKWGDYLTPPSHGFGGITGRVKLLATDQVYINDVYIKHTPVVEEVEVNVGIQNNPGKELPGKLSFTLTDYSGEEGQILEQSMDITVPAGACNIVQKIRHSGANLWSPDNPNLYNMKVKWEGTDGSVDDFSRKFGFRWFEVKEINGDKQFYLNGKRIVLISAISWGFWPVNGIYPTDRLAEKQVSAAKELGLNMLNFHRGIGQSNVLNYADQYGLLYYEEPGGYITGQDEFSRAWNREKFLRMVKRDRNHPSLIIYNMQNEAARDPDEYHQKDILEFHELDETRYITFTSSHFPGYFYEGKCPKTPAGVKMFMEPYNHEIFYQGWWDEHHAGGPGVYLDYFYEDLENYRRYTDHASEIVFYGEEGAIGTPARLELIRDEINASGKYGWDGEDYIKLYDAYENFLSGRGFKKAFPTVDAFTNALGNVAFYHQGRIIENIRINNLVDGYVINGWEGEKLENHSGIVDCFRNPKGNIHLIADYNRPLYLAVKARNKVVEEGSDVLVDIHIVNQEGLTGDFILNVTATSEDEQFFTEQYNVQVVGSDQYGQILKESIQIPVTKAGYTTL